MPIKHINKLVFSIGKDAKTVKGERFGYLTGILYLAPSNISGYQICAMANLAGCENACLYKAGHGAFNNVQQARIAKTKRFFEDREGFLKDIIYSINRVIKKAEKEGLKPLIRLNGTSDIVWESIPILIDGKLLAVNIFELFPTVQFYDYTKHPTRKNIPKNYDLTFSYSGLPTYQGIVKKALLNDKLSRIAVVFDKVSNIPKSFMGRDVLPGDDSDVRHLDAPGTIVALYAKGPARKDASGFVVR